MEDAARQSDRAYNELKELIVTVKLTPDALISEREMMARLNVGRTPLREALQRLASDHLVRSVPRRGYFVAGVTYRGVLHSYELRRCVEGLATRLAAERASDEERQLLRDLLHEAEEGIDSQDGRWQLQVDTRLHELIADASHNPFIRQVLGELYDVSVRELYLSRRPITLVQDEIDTYRALVDAICRGDGETAERLMHEHLEPDIGEVRWARGYRVHAPMPSESEAAADIVPAAPTT